MSGIDVEEALLILKVAFLVLLYVFIWVIVRAATRDVRTAPQESIILSAADASALRDEAGIPAPQPVPPASHGTLHVLAGPALPAGSVVEITGTTTFGRGAECSVTLDDDFVSSRHARVDARDGALWIEDTGSTNGTFVNGARVTSERQLRAGDVIRIGHTDFRVDA